jgi:FkbM family methyltransferase
MYVDLRSSIGRGILVTGVFDPLVFDPIAEALARGGNFLDIGANVGYYSVLAAHILDGRGCVHAFEVDSRPLQCLRRNASSIGKGGIVVHELAVGAVSGVARLSQSNESGHTRVTQSDKGSTVPMITIDEWRRAQGVRDIRAIKIDIEGGEYAALLGAAETVATERPIIVFEVLENAEALGGAARSDLVSLLEKLNYRVLEVVGTHSPTLVAHPLVNGIVNPAS